MWRRTKIIIISWLVGVACGAGIVVLLQRDDRIPPASSAVTQTTPQTSGAAPASRDDTDAR
jgi:hypothetical protein